MRLGELKGLPKVIPGEWQSWAVNQALATKSTLYLNLPQVQGQGLGIPSRWLGRAAWIVYIRHGWRNGAHLAGAFQAVFQDLPAMSSIWRLVVGRGADRILYDYKLAVATGNRLQPGLEPEQFYSGKGSQVGWWAPCPWRYSSTAVGPLLLVMFGEE